MAARIATAQYVTGITRATFDDREGEPPIFAETFTLCLAVANPGTGSPLAHQFHTCFAIAHDTRLITIAQAQVSFGEGIQVDQFLQIFASHDKRLVSEGTFTVVGCQEGFLATQPDRQVDPPERWP